MKLSDVYNQHYNELVSLTKDFAAEKSKINEGSKLIDKKNAEHIEEDGDKAPEKIEQNDLDNEDMQERGPGRKLLFSLYWSNKLAEREKERADMKLKMRASLRNELNDEDFLKIARVGEHGDQGAFPWEKKDIQVKEDAETEDDGLQLEKPVGWRDNAYVVEGWQGRQLLDTFGNSLRHVNRLYNKAFGIAPRKVPGHMPHFIDKNIMFELQARFPDEWNETSSHKVRSSRDMQYAFAYYYYLIGMSKDLIVEDVFYEMDTDRSGYVII